MLTKHTLVALAVGSTVIAMPQPLRLSESSVPWIDNLGGPDSASFAPIADVTKRTIQRLGIAWTYPDALPGFNPVVAHDVLYTATRLGELVALDASSGKELWVRSGLTGISSRGINYWEDDNGRDRRLLFVIENFLHAVDASTGRSVASFGDNGFVDLRVGLRRGDLLGGNTNSPGKVWNNLVILGLTTGEYYMAPPGDIRAYDVRTGRRVWTFHTIPQPGEFGYDTWPTDAYLYAGGANTWGSVSIDDNRGIVYVPTGSATYDFYGADRIGANLFANCLIALDARTGRRLWHFQMVHHDLWDMDNVAAPMLITVRHRGRTVDAVAQAGKTGFLYVFNRVDGSPLWPIEERPVRASQVPYERAWPTQPFPTRPAPFAKQAFDVDDVSPWLLDTAAYESFRARVGAAIKGSGPQGGLFNPPQTDAETIMMPGSYGGANWGTTAAYPSRGLVFVSNVNQVSLLRLEDVAKRTPGTSAQAGSRLGEVVYRDKCSSCHGDMLQGGTAPSLLGVARRMSADVIGAILSDGRGGMPAFSLSPEQMTSVMAYLVVATVNQTARARQQLRPAGSVRPVVSDRTTRPAILRPTMPRYQGFGGNAGDYAYPAGLVVPPTRFMSEYGVEGVATRPPYSEIVAYDLNTGEIRWRRPNGDDARTLANGGPRNTGSIGVRNGMLVTSGGLVFQLGGDGKFRAYNIDTGSEIWSALVPGAAVGVPASYKARGRQYVAVIGGWQPRSTGSSGPSVSAGGLVAFSIR